MPMVILCHMRRAWYGVVLTVLGVTLLAMYLTQPQLTSYVRVAESSASSHGFDDEIYCRQKVYISCPDVENETSSTNAVVANGGESVGQGKGQVNMENLVSSAASRDRLKTSETLSESERGALDASDGLARIRAKTLKNLPLRISVINVPKYFKGMVNQTESVCGGECVISAQPPTSATDVVVACSASLHARHLPTERWPGQLYVAYSREAPIHYGAEIWKETSPWRYAFNLIASYQLSTDIFCPYDNLELEVKPEHERPNYEEIAAKKTKMAVWIVSNCRADSMRHIYVTELQKYIDVDIYGNCGKKLACPFGGDCYKEVLKPYKFYLAFENSFCEDYITEKIFKTFTEDSHIIPVVRGAGNYEAYFPNRTFINTADFRTPSELALHLQKLASDPKTLSGYLERRDMFKLLPRTNHFCYICGKLREGNFQPKVYDIRKWMSDQCYPPTDLGSLEPSQKVE